MKKLKSISVSLVFVAFILFGGEKEGFSQGHDVQVIYPTDIQTLMDVQVVYSKSPELRSLGGGVGSGLILGQDKGNRFLHGGRNGFFSDKGNGFYIKTRPYELQDVQVVYLKNFSSGKGNGLMLWKEGHGLTAGHRVGNGFSTGGGNLIGNDSHGLSKGAEGIFLLRGGSDIGGLVNTGTTAFFGGDAAGI